MLDEPEGKLLSINAPTESWFHSLKTEQVHHQTYQTKGVDEQNIRSFQKGI